MIWIISFLDSKDIKGWLKAFIIVNSFRQSWRKHFGSLVFATVCVRRFWKLKNLSVQGFRDHRAPSSAPSNGESGGGRQKTRFVLSAA
jgi:hypothetical protein